MQVRHFLLVWGPDPWPWEVRRLQGRLTVRRRTGTRLIMTESFYRKRLVAHGVDLLPPDMDVVETLDGIIYQELMLGKVTRSAERALRTIITRKEQDGAKAIVLACTELELVVDVDANVLPIFDSTQIHCEAGVEWIFGSE